MLPVLDLGATAAVPPSVSIQASWQRLRLRVEAAGGAGLMFDLRLGGDTSGPSILKKGPRPLDDLGQVGVLVSDEHVGERVCLLVHPPGMPQDVLAKRVDTIKD